MLINFTFDILGANFFFLLNIPNASLNINGMNFSGHIYNEVFLTTLFAFVFTVREENTQ